MSSGLFLLVLLALATGAFLYSRKSQALRFWQNKQGEEFLEQLQQWFADVEPPQVPIEEFKGWLAARNPEEAQILTKQIASFAHDANFDLSWVTEEQLDQNPQLKEALSEVVIFYCMANFKTSQFASQIKAFVIFKRWQKKPDSPELHEFSRLLFARLIDKGLVKPAPSDLFLASEKERQKYAVAAINQSAEKAQDSFNATLEEVILSLDL